MSVAFVTILEIFSASGHGQREREREREREKERERRHRVAEKVAGKGHIGVIGDDI